MEQTSFFMKDYDSSPIKHQLFNIFFKKGWLVKDFTQDIDIFVFTYFLVSLSLGHCQYGF
jgi:hypothetical protein